MQVSLTLKSLRKRRQTPHGDLEKNKKAVIRTWKTWVLREHTVVWLSSETRKHFKNCYNCWRSLKQGKVKRLFPDFNGRAVDGLCWLKDILSRLSFSHRGHKDSSGCRDVETPGRRDEMPWVGRRKVRRSCRFLTAIAINKASGWQVFILELSLCNLWLQESEREMKADSETQLQSFPALGN